MAAAAQARCAGAANEDTERDFTLTVPLLVDVHSGAASKRSRAEMLNEELVKVRRALYFDLGVAFPGIQLRFNDQLPPRAPTRSSWPRCRCRKGELRPGHLLVRETPENLTALSAFRIETDKKFLPQPRDDLGRRRVSSDCIAHGGHRASWTPTQLLSYHIAFVLKKYAGGLHRHPGDARSLLDRPGAAAFPELVKEVQRVLPIQKIAEILQRLVSEEVSIRNLAHDHGGAHRVGPEGEGFGAADRIRAHRRSSATISHKYSQRPEHPARVPVARRTSKTRFAAPSARPRPAATSRSIRSISQAAASTSIKQHRRRHCGRARSGRCCSPRWTSAATCAS